MRVLRSLNLRLYAGAPVQTTQQLVNNVTNLRFRYYDEEGNETADLEEIRAVQISMTVEEDAGTGGHRRTVLYHPCALPKLRHLDIRDTSMKTEFDNMEYLESGQMVPERACRMIRPLRSLTNENGSAIVIALMLLSLLTVMGIWSTRKSNIETLIAGNEVARKQTFFRTEGGVIEGGFAIEEAATGDLSSRAPVWLTEASIAPDMTDPDNWDFDEAGADDTAVPSAIR